MTKSHLLFPPSLNERILKNYSIRMVSAISDKLDISALEPIYKNCDTSSFHPHIRLKVVYPICATILRTTDVAPAAEERKLYAAIGDVASGLPDDKPLPQRAT